MAWSTGQPWRVVNSLNQLNAQIRAYAPRAVPPATNVDSWGSIADNAHSTSSDHYPHYYTALGGTAVVCARDFPHAPNLGLDGGVVTEHLRQQRDPRIQYIIFNGRITGVSYGWQWATYTGDDDHSTHFHVSSVHTAAADQTQNFSLPGGAVAATSKGIDMIRVMVQGGDGAVWLTGPSPLHIGPNLNADLAAGGVPMVQVDDTATLNAVLNSQKVPAMTATATVDTAAIVTGVLQGLADSPDSEVTQADVDALVAKIDATPEAVMEALKARVAS